MLKVFICEDNNLQRDKIKSTVENTIIIENLDMKVALSTGKTQDIIDYLENNKGSGLYFIDIDLNSDMNGIQLAERIRQYDPRGFIVFVTTHGEMSYLTFIYKIEVMDYIIKDDYSNVGERIYHKFNIKSLILTKFLVTV